MTRHFEKKTTHFEKEIQCSFWGLNKPTLKINQSVLSIRQSLCSLKKKKYVYITNSGIRLIISLMICKLKLLWFTFFENGEVATKEAVQLPVHHSIDYRRNVPIPHFILSKQIIFKNRSKRKRTEKGWSSAVNEVHWYWKKMSWPSYDFSPGMLNHLVFNRHC